MTGGPEPGRSGLVECAQQLGLNPLTLTPEERQDLGYWGHIRTDEERKAYAEYKAKHSIRPFTQEEMEQWLRHGLRPPTLGEVIERILEMIGKGIKAIRPKP